MFDKVYKVDGNMEFLRSGNYTSCPVTFKLELRRFDIILEIQDPYEYNEMVHTEFKLRFPDGSSDIEVNIHISLNSIRSISSFEFNTSLRLNFSGWINHAS